MRKLSFICGPVVLACILFAVGRYVLLSTIQQADAYTVPVTYVDGQVLTSSQLNTCNDTAANAFNGHDHSGTDGEASTLAFTSNTVSFTEGGDITFNGAASSLECDGTTAVDVLIDQGNFGVIVGSGGSTSEQSITLKSGAAQDASLIFTETGATHSWTLGHLAAGNEFQLIHGGSTEEQFQISGVSTGTVDLVIDGGIATDSLTATPIAWETYTGTTCAYTNGNCTTTVDSSAPGTGAPLSWCCTISDGTDSFTFCSRSQDAGGNVDCAGTYYDTAGDDLELILNGASSCTDAAYSEQAYKCIVFYVQ